MRPPVLVVLLFTFLRVAHGFDEDLPPYDIVQITAQPANAANEEILEFSAFGRFYKALVRPQRLPIHHNFRLINEQSDDFFADFDGTVGGHLLGNPTEKVFLTKLTGGAYVGYVEDAGEVLHLEPADLHVPDAQKRDTLVYKESDLKVKNRINHGLSSPILPPQLNRFSKVQPNPFHLWKRLRREVSSLPNEKVNRCSLKIVADYRFFEVAGKSSKASTTRYILNTIARVNEIFRVVNWDEDNEDKVENRGRFYNFGFSIKELKILDRPSRIPGHYNGNDTENGGVWSSNRLLEAFTKMESSPDYCIVHLMTAQSFYDRSSLGLAYVAGAGSSNGGICSDPVHFFQFPERMGAYNTLFTSVVGNSGKKDYPLVTREAEIVVAHEYGHSWGAVHDERNLHTVSGLNDTCMPDFHQGGKYIMNPYAQIGYDPNNNRFSPCSIYMIRTVLGNRWKRCFEEEQTSLCGNGVVEEGEECDEGALLSVTSGVPEVPCCTRDCKLLATSQCSPLNHQCCSQLCSFHNQSHVCSPKDDWQCQSVSHCSGFSGDCPPPTPLPDGIHCADDGECQNGQCVPFCEKSAIGKKSCICEELHLSCRRCCSADNGTGPCVPEEGAKDLVDGSWCVQGYCKQSRCITEVADYIEYYLKAIQEGSLFFKFVSSNIVGIVVVSSVPLWCIVGYWISSYDRRQRELQDRVLQVDAPATVPPPFPLFPPREPSPVVDTDFF